MHMRAMTNIDGIDNFGQACVVHVVTWEDLVPQVMAR